jgi:hypothetical protein
VPELLLLLLLLRQITVPGPHTASVSAVGRSITMNLTPLGPSHPALNPVGLTSSVSRWVHRQGNAGGSSMQRDVWILCCMLVARQPASQTASQQRASAVWVYVCQYIDCLGVQKNVFVRCACCW